ncbi:MAG: helix-turn-helix transcriptional regulator [Flavobacteriia bacterium]|jgi:proteasome accessory factor C|nr:HTH domain-containing protein [Cryomorphaceae bacterium]
MLNQHKILRVLQLISLLKQEPAKSIHQLGAIIDTTDRTVYRYFDLLRELGFELQRDLFNRYSIPAGSGEGGVKFTNEEGELIRKMVLNFAKNHPLKDSILKKIYLASETTIVSSHLLKAHLGRIVEMLSEAIETKKQVVLKNYHSLNSQKISDRYIEPFAFTDNYRALMAYEPTSGQNKYFNIERITNVELLDGTWVNQDKHALIKPDAFGFGPTGEEISIHFEMSLRAYLLLKEEYPLCSPYLKKIQNSDRYELKMKVNSRVPIDRFARGLNEEMNEHTD